MVIANKESERATPAAIVGHRGMLHILLVDRDLNFSLPSSASQ